MRNHLPRLYLALALLVGCSSESVHTVQVTPPEGGAELEAGNTDASADREVLPDAGDVQVMSVEASGDSPPRPPSDAHATEESPAPGAPDASTPVACEDIGDGTAACAWAITCTTIDAGKDGGDAATVCATPWHVAAACCENPAIEGGSANDGGTCGRPFRKTDGGIVFRAGEFSGLRDCKAGGTPSAWCCP